MRQRRQPDRRRHRQDAGRALARRARCAARGRARRRSSRAATASARAGVVVVGEAGGRWSSPEEGGDEAVHARAALRRARSSPASAAPTPRRVACARFGARHDRARRRLPAPRARARRRPRAARRRRGARTAAARRPAARAGGGARAARAPSSSSTVPAAGRAAGRPARSAARLGPTRWCASSGDAWVEEPLAALAGRDVVAVAGVARPERFAATLERCGARGPRRCSSSPTITPTTRPTSPRIAGGRARRVLVTTEKDLVKLGGAPGLDGPARAARRRSRSTTATRLRRPAWPAGTPAASGFARRLRLREAHGRHADGDQQGAARTSSRVPQCKGDVTLTERGGRARLRRVQAALRDQGRHPDHADR